MELENGLKAVKEGRVTFINLLPHEVKIVNE